eukprot:TRINITY_DN107078_c0_g1_i1.p1 TRINITY_DN107078_c0_g1~~TRINITY_DN107078_c0_g1_i1.p1  ORF type:complete len:422 (-),score=38.61 TRINITY_DN107078_c0_g1_i1:59-1324(-)
MGYVAFEFRCVLELVCLTTVALGQPGAPQALNVTTEVLSDFFVAEGESDRCNAADVVECIREREYWEIFLFCLFLTLSIVLLMLCGVRVGVGIKPPPPRYWTASGLRSLFNDSYHREVDMSDELCEPVQRLFNYTTAADCMGKGQDGKWATHKRFEVLKVIRIENGHQWSNYRRTVRSNVMPVLQKMRAMARLSPPFCKYTQDSLTTLDSRFRTLQGDVKVKQFLDSIGLDSGRNERLLFHGSPGKGARDSNGCILFNHDEFSPVHAIKHVGFDERLGNVKGMYGAGTYFGDMCSKADQYAGRYNSPTNPQGSVGEVATIFLSRVCLGCPYFTQQSLEQLKRPPCVQGHFDLTLYWNQDVVQGRPWNQKFAPTTFCVCKHPRFDSVVAGTQVDGKPRLYREFVVYDNVAYPEFCVTYRRVL